MSFPLHIEILQPNESYFTNEAVAILAEKFLFYLETVMLDKIYRTRDDYYEGIEDIERLRSHVEAITVGNSDKTIVNVKEEKYVFFVYKVNSQCMYNIQMDNQQIATETILPSRDLFGLWESLIFEQQMKAEILRFAGTTILLSNINIDSNLITLNRVILFHGPPGTGKTSLCRALAQKLSIQFSNKYKETRLVEINTHNLFSKWFSESGKQVMKLFAHLHMMAKNPLTLICVLIDEVETLLHARAASTSGTDPLDSLRVVNAVLTQLDSVKKYPNVLIMTTTNITGSIDPAFIDRADLKQYIGNPDERAIYEIYLSSLQELTTNGVIHAHEKMLSYMNARRIMEEDGSNASVSLCTAAKNSVGLSGRTLRKIPLLAQALYLQRFPVHIEDFLDAMNKAIQRKLCEKQTVNL